MRILILMNANIALKVSKILIYCLLKQIKKCNVIECYRQDVNMTMGCIVTLTGIDICIFMPKTLKKSGEHIGFVLCVRVSVHASIRAQI